MNTALLLPEPTTLESAVPGKFQLARSSDEFEDPVSLAVSPALGEGLFPKALLVMHAVEGGLLMGVKGTYFCDAATVDVSITERSGKRRFRFPAQVSGDRTRVAFRPFEQADFEEAFLEGEVLAVRINQGHCSDDIFRFSLAGAEEALGHLRGYPAFEEEGLPGEPGEEAAGEEEAATEALSELAAFSSN